VRQIGLVPSRTDADERHVIDRQREQPGMLIAVLIVLNTPLFLGIGWLMFDTKQNAADTVFDTIFAILGAILTAISFRGITGVLYDDGIWGIVPVAAFFIACGLLVYGEYYVIRVCFP
jgi:hypothetical protein